MCLSRRRRQERSGAGDSDCVWSRVDRTLHSTGEMRESSRDLHRIGEWHELRNLAKQVLEKHASCLHCTRASAKGTALVHFLLSRSSHSCSPCRPIPTFLLISTTFVRAYAFSDQILFLMVEDRRQMLFSLFLELS